MHVLIYVLCLSLSVLIIYPRVKGEYTFRLVLVAILFALFSATISTDKLSDRLAYDFMFLFRFPQDHNTIYSIFHTTIEPAFIVLNLVIHKLTQNSFWLYFVSTFMMVFLDTYTIKRISPRYKLTVIYYLISLQVFFGTFLLRQGIAAAIVSLAFLMYVNRRKKTAILFVILAISFHASAVIMLPIYIILLIFKSINMRKVWTFAISSLIVVVFYDSVMAIIFNIQFISDNFGSYLGVNLQSGYMVALKGTPYHLITLFSILERKKILKKLNNAGIYFVFAIMNSLFWILAVKMYWLWRLSMFTIVPTLILMTYIFEVTDNKYKTLFYRVSISILMIFITIREIIVTIY